MSENRSASRDYQPRVEPGISVRTMSGSRAASHRPAAGSASTLHAVAISPRTYAAAWSTAGPARDSRCVLPLPQPCRGGHVGGHLSVRRTTTGSNQPITWSPSQGIATAKNMIGGMPGVATAVWRCRRPRCFPHLRGSGRAIVPVERGVRPRATVSSASGAQPMTCALSNSPAAWLRGCDLGGCGPCT